MRGQEQYFNTGSMKPRDLEAQERLRLALRRIVTILPPDKFRPEHVVELVKGEQKVMPPVTKHDLSLYDADLALTISTMLPDGTDTLDPSRPIRYLAAASIGKPLSLISLIEDETPTGERVSQIGYAGGKAASEIMASKLIAFAAGIELGAGNQ